MGEEPAAFMHMHIIPRAIWVIAFVTVLTIGAGTATADHGADINSTVMLDDHSPGASNDFKGVLTVRKKMEALGIEKFERLEYSATKANGFTFNCGANDALEGVAGIDRGDDQPFPNVDKQFGLNDVKGTGTMTSDKLASTYTSEIPLSKDDEISQYFGGNCLQNPSEPGWYQLSNTLKVTLPDGNERTFKFKSHHVYICDCETRQQAVNKLGEPPQSGGENGTGGPSAATDTGGTTATTASGPGFGSVAAFAGLFGAIILAVQRARH